MSTQEKLAAELSIVYPEIVTRIEDKISKVILDLENFHAKSERGVKQEVYDHFILINLARFFEFESSKNLEF